MRLGVISDTHGLLRPEALEWLRGSDHIVHAGDIGRPEILAALAELAPVSAVRGNVDTAPWAADLPESLSLRLPGLALTLVHDIAQLEEERAAGADLVIFGHSHRPGIERRGSVLYLNPGSAGPRRFRLPVTLATADVGPGGAAAQIHTLLP